jgi:hypothetical protein
LCAQRRHDARIGEHRRIDPAGDLAHRIEDRPRVGGEGGRGAGILLGNGELDDQGHDLVLPAVVQVALQLAPSVDATEARASWPGSRRR